MTTEDQEVQTQTTEEAAQSLNAGFNKVRGDTHEEPAEQKTEEKIEATPALDPKGEPAAAVEEPIVFAGLTESQLKTQLAKVGEVDTLRDQVSKLRDTVMGRTGNLEQIVKELRERPAGQGFKVSGAQLKRVREGYGELADLLAEDLSEIVSAPAAAAETDADLAKKVSAEFEPKLQELQKKLDESNQRNTQDKQESEMRRVTEKHPDWATERNTSEFKLWKQTLPAEAQNVLATTWNSEVLIKAFDGFKTWKAAGATPKPDSTKRLENAITPKSNSAAPAKAVLPDEEGLSVGFNKVRKRA